MRRWRRAAFIVDLALSAPEASVSANTNRTSSYLKAEIFFQRRRHELGWYLEGRFFHATVVQEELDNLDCNS